MATLVTRRIRRTASGVTTLLAVVVVLRGWWQLRHYPGPLS